MENLFEIPKDASVINRSDEGFSEDGITIPGMERLFLQFKNGNTISIIRGQYSYGGPEGFFEIMPGDVTDCLSGTDLEMVDDNVEGWLTVQDVNKYIEKLNNG